MSNRNGNGDSTNGAVRLAAFPFVDKNPYMRLLYDALGRAGIDAVPDPRLEARWLWRHRRRVSFLHFHWDKFYYESNSRRPRFRGMRSWAKLVRYAALLLSARALGYRIIWTIHEVVPHEPRSHRRDLLAARILARLSHALVAHDEATAHRAGNWLGIGSADVVVIPHGSYAGVYPRGRARDEVRADWGLDPSTFVFLAFGNLRSYKRLELLLDAFSRIESPDAALVIAGEFLWRFREPHWERRLVAKLRAHAARDPRIRYRIARVPDEQVAELHRACDAAVMARSDGWTSGSMILALSQGLPVLAARTPAYESLLGDGAAGWLYEPGSVDSLADALARAVSERELAGRKADHATRIAAALGWDGIAASTASVMLSTLPGRQT